MPREDKRRTPSESRGSENERSEQTPPGGGGPEEEIWGDAMGAEYPSRLPEEEALKRTPGTSAERQRKDGAGNTWQ